MNIIITGASRGIGYETAKLLSAQGHSVINVSRSASKHPQKGVIAIDFDLETGNIQDLLSKIKQQFKTVDVLINNAAAFIKKPFAELTRKDFEKIYSVNLFSVAELIQRLSPLLLSPLKGGTGEASGAHVLNISSMGGIQGSLKFPGLSAYSSSKGALITLTECLAEEHKNKGIAFNAIAFGSVQTEMLEAAFPGFKAPMNAQTAAEFVAHFAVNGQKFFNGKIIQMALSTP